jgi:hypothetical protein
MAEVYGGAFITICATATTNSTQSIFKLLPDNYIQESLGRGRGVVIRIPIAPDTIMTLSPMGPKGGYISDPARESLFWRAW